MRTSMIGSGSWAVFLGAISLLLLAPPSVLRAAEGAGIRNWGKQLFTKHCAPCHGADGRGGGPVAAALRTRPADLTQITRRHEGKFPFLQVVAFIDGERPVAAHGSREMPIWGDIFRWQSGEHAARAEIYALAQYIESIQDERR
jgi:mono/diheme cytochrome c family protein